MVVRTAIVMMHAQKYGNMLSLTLNENALDTLYSISSCAVCDR